MTTPFNTARLPNESVTDWGNRLDREWTARQAVPPAPSAKGMTPVERAKALAALVRAADADRPPPPAGEKRYDAMTARERAEFRRLHNLPSTYNR